MLDRRRREFITLLGGAAAWPIAARAQQPAMSTIGWLNVRSPEMSAHLVAAFHQGLRATGYLSGLPLIATAERTCRHRRSGPKPDS
jgi:putative tryptophan/tyrosine transport system substrate-binding protein